MANDKLRLAPNHMAQSKAAESMFVEDNMRNRVTNMDVEIHAAINGTSEVKDSIILDLSNKYMVIKYANKVDIPKELFVEIVLTAHIIASKYGVKVDSSNLLGEIRINGYFATVRKYLEQHDQLTLNKAPLFMIEHNKDLTKLGLVSQEGPGISHLAISSLIALHSKNGKGDLFIPRDHQMYEQIEILYKRNAGNGGEFTVHHDGVTFNCHIMMWNSSYKIKIGKGVKQ
jgi:hypothetical protein